MVGKRLMTGESVVVYRVRIANLPTRPNSWVAVNEHLPANLRARSGDNDRVEIAVCKSEMMRATRSGHGWTSVWCSKRGGGSAPV